MRLEAFRGDLLAALAARAVRAVLDALERRVDLRAHLLGILAERVVDLAAECRACGVADVVVARARDLLGLVVDRPGMTRLQVGDRSLNAAALLEERSAELVDVDGHDRLSFLLRSGAAAEARRRSMSAGPSPVSSTILS